MINQATDIHPRQFCLIGVHISKVRKFFAESPGVTNHAVQLTDPFDTAHLLIIPPQFGGVTSHFDVYSPSIAEYENEEIPRTHLTADELPWDQSTNEYSEREIFI